MATLAPFERKHRVTVVGSGNWGSAIAKIVAENTAAHPNLFEPTVQMWVFEEDYSVEKTSKHFDPAAPGPQKLTTLINRLHENVKYLPGIALPPNVHASPSLIDSVRDATILIFNLPHQFLKRTCQDLQGHTLPYARGISCIKGVHVTASNISLFSEVIGETLGIYCGALSGANIANEVAQEKFSETTVAYDPPPSDSQNPSPAGSSAPALDMTAVGERAVSSSKRRLHPLPSELPPLDRATLKALFHRPYFHVRVVSDVTAVSLAGALKNVVALAAGFVSGLQWGDNAKAAIMRVGLVEMVRFGHKFFPHSGIRTATFTEESAGVADLITSCSGGRNYRCAKMAIERNVPVREVEQTELNGQRLAGVGTAEEVNAFLKTMQAEQDFPLLTAVHRILHGEAQAADIPDMIDLQ